MGIGIKIALDGAVDTQKKINQVQARMKGEIRKVTFQEAHLLRRMIVTGIRRQAPGGQKFLPLAPSTIAAKGSSKALIDDGDLIRSVNVTEMGSGAVFFVGVHKSATDNDGNVLANIAEVHEFGTKDGHVPERPYLRPSFNVWKRGIQGRMIVRIADGVGFGKHMAETMKKRTVLADTTKGFKGSIQGVFSKTGKMSWRIN